MQQIITQKKHFYYILQQSFFSVKETHRSTQYNRKVDVIGTENLKQQTMATMTISYDGRSSVMQHLIEAMLAAGAKMLSSSDANGEFYSDKKALRSFKQSVEQEKQGMAREVSLDDVKQMLCL